MVGKSVLPWGRGTLKSKGGEAKEKNQKDDRHQGKDSSHPPPTGDTNQGRNVKGGKNGKRTFP